MKSFPFPAVIYVAWSESGDAAPYLTAEAALGALAGGVGVGAVRVGTYRLVEESELRAVAEVRRKGTKTWGRR